MVYIIGQKSKEIDPYKAKTSFVGTQAVKDGRLYGDKRCEICGDYITWADVEPQYCFEPSVARRLKSGGGKGRCEDWYTRRIRFIVTQNDTVHERAMELMSIFKKRGLVH